jgi:hypothetical protein
VSKAKETFDQAILDAENLLAHFKTLNSHPPPPELEVLKRAGLVMAMTAWETYVEDRLVEACNRRLEGLSDSQIAGFVASKLGDEIKRLHNPNSTKTIELFKEYAGVDLGESWALNPLSSRDVRKRLDGYIKLRGDVVHRSRPVSNGPPTAHPVKKDHLEKAISFLRRVVEATESALANPTSNV